MGTGRLLVALLAATMFAACGGGSSSSDSTSGTTGGGSGGGTGVTNSLGKAYPGDLAVSSPTASSSSSSSVNVNKSLVNGVATAEVAPPPITEQKKEIQNILNATSKSGCKFSFDFSATPPAANCYGPNLNYTNHPDRAGGEPPNGQLPPGDLGIWEENNAASGEACVAAKMNNLVGEVITNVQIATEMGAAILCAANLESKALPDKGVDLDLKSIAQSVMTDNGIPMTFSTVILNRAASDTADGFAIYTMQANGSVSFAVQGQGSQSSNFEMTLKHIPTKSDNTTYKGRLSLKVELPLISFGPFAAGNCGGASGLTDAFSIEYEKTSETSLTYLLRRAEFCGKNVNPFDSKMNVDLSKKKAGAVTDGWGNDGNYARFNINPEDGTGNFAYAWQAGPNDGNTRVLEAKVTKSGTAVTGCGYFGYGPDIAATGTGVIDRIICNWAGPGNSHTGVAKAQRQCFAKSAATGKMVSTSSNLAITYAPTNSCDKTMANNFSYATQDNSSSVATGADVTNNLIGLSSVDVTLPTAPSVP